MLAELDKNQEMFPPAGGYLYVPVFLWKCMWRGAQIPKKPGTVRSVTLYIINLKILKLKKIKSGVPEPPFYTFTVVPVHTVQVWM